MFLVRQDKVQNFFIKFIFGRKAKVLTNFKGINSNALTESASFISDANTAIAALGDEEQLGTYLACPAYINCKQTADILWFFKCKQMTRIS